MSSGVTEVASLPRAGAVSGSRNEIRESTGLDKLTVTVIITVVNKPVDVLCASPRAVVQNSCRRALSRIREPRGGRAGV